MDESRQPASKWPAGKSEMHGRVRAHDWAATTLGPIAAWPPSLKFAVDFTLNAGFPSLLLWGEDLIQIYNDPYLFLARGLEAPLGVEFYRSWPDSVARGMPLFERVWRGETVVVEESRNAGPAFFETDPAWLTSSISPVFDESGEIAGISIIIDELTQRVLTEMALREKEAQLSNLLDLLPVGITLYDADGQIIKINPEVLRHFETPDLSSLCEAPWKVFDREGGPLAADDYPMARALRGEVVTPEAEMLVDVNGTRRWLQVGAVPYFRDGRIDGCIAISHDVTQAKESADRLRVLVAELQHRTRNLIAVVCALADKTIEGSASLADFETSFRTRLGALARVQGLLSRLTEGRRVTFDELLHAELEAQSAFEDGRVTLDGPSGVPLRSSTVQTLALALHELATNAVKHGALGQPQGRLAVRWRVEPAASGHGPYILHVHWQESGVTMPADEAKPIGFGYGRQLIERALPYQFGAETQLTFGADGVACTIALEIAGHDEAEQAQSTFDASQSSQRPVES